MKKFNSRPFMIDENFEFMVIFYIYIRFSQSNAIELESAFNGKDDEIALKRRCKNSRLKIY